MTKIIKILRFLTAMLCVAFGLSTVNGGLVDLDAINVWWNILAAFFICGGILHLILADRGE